jgi:hypothetical protein
MTARPSYDTGAMPTPTTLHHLALPAGLGRQSYAAEISAPVLRDVLAIVRAGRGNLEGLEVVLRPPAWCGCFWTLGRPSGLVAVECVLCWHAAASSKAWAAVRAAAPRGVLEPPVPWLVTTLLPAAAKILSAELQAVVGRVARSVAWALIADARVS